MKNLKKLLALSIAFLAIFLFFSLVGNNVARAAVVNINTAGLTELDTIPEVGPTIAQRIIDYRIANGEFSKIEDIVNVKGIGDITFSKMKAFITVGDSGGENNGNTTPVEDDDADDSANNTDDNESSGDDDESAHYEQEGLSNYTEATGVFKVSAGRERMSYVGSPVAFEAKAKLSASTKENSVDYTWSFGDGSSARGEKVTHFYKYAGEYNVVLNAEVDGENSVSRTVVRVLSPSLTIAEISDGSLEIVNKSKQEINLYNWSVVSGAQKYVFPLDTIISAGQKNIFPLDYTKFAVNENPWLVDATGKGVMPININPNKNSAIPGGKTITLAEFQKLVLEIKKVQPIAPTRQLVESTGGNEEYWSDHYKKVTEQVLGTSTVDANEASSTERSDLAVSEEETVGFWSRVFHPVRTIKRAFYQ